jgi:hypothetical protein
MITRKNMRRFLIVLTVAAVVFCGALVTTAMALEEPEYTVVERHDDWELRRYEPYLVAETQVNGDLRQSGNAAFRVLAGYIFGDNDASTKMAMTAPVLSESIDDGEYRYQFVMERAYDLESLPVPNSGRVEIREIPPRLMAATTFLRSLDEEGFTPKDDPLLARYNPPITPWFLRRNEILVEVAPKVN